MKHFVQEVMDRLAGDSELSNLTDDIRYRGVPDEPKNISAPEVSTRFQGGEDAPERHGAAVNYRVQVKIFAYDRGNQLQDTIQAAQRISELFLQPFTLSDGSQTFRLASTTGWQDTPQPDNRFIQFENTYGTRVWSKSRIQAINN